MTADYPTPFSDGALYDLIFENLDQGLRFYMELAHAANGPVLDLCCGTGRVLLPCLKSGIDIEGLDLFAPMLARLRDKARAAGLHPTLHEASMTNFRLARRFALIIIPNNAIVHNLTPEDQIATLRTCREHLLPGGLLAFDTAFPGPGWIFAPSGTRALEAEIPHPTPGLSIRMWDTRTFDRVNQIQQSHNEIEVLDAAGKIVEAHHSETAVRWIYKGEMELLLRVAGFSRWQISGDFERRPLEHETDAMIVEAWNSGNM